MKLLRRKALAYCICLTALTDMAAHNLREVTNNDGLNSNFVLSLGQTKNGLMMFGSINGLNFYDGNQVWTTDLSGKLFLGNLVEDMATVGDNQSWVLTNHGLNVITDKGRLVEYFPQFKGLRSIRTSAHGGDAFMMDDDALHYRDGKGTFRTISLPGMKANEVRNYAITDRWLYIFHQHGIFRYTLTRHQDGYTVGGKQLLDSADIHSACGRSGTVYLTDAEDRLFRYDMKSGYKRHIASLHEEVGRRGNVRDIIEFKGKLFIAFSNHGVVTLDLQSKNPQFRDIGIKTGVFQLLKDRLGDIVWIATDGQGVAMYCDEPYSMRTITMEKLGLETTCSVRGVLGRPGALWVATKGDGLLMFPSCLPMLHTSPKIVTQSNSQLSSDVVYCLEQSSGGGFWIGTAEGLCYGINQPSDIRTIDTELPIKEVSAIKEVGGQLWMATMGYGIYRADISYHGGYPQLSNVRQFTVDDGKMSSNYFFCLARDKQDTWWFGNRGKGLFVLDKEQLVSIAPDTTRFKDPLIHDVYTLLPVGGDIWVGTGCGIAIGDNKGFKKEIDTRHGLPSNAIAGIALCSNGDVWVSTNKGLAVLTVTGEVKRTFSKEELEILEYSGGAAAFHDNSVYLGGTNGLTIFRYDGSVRPQQHAPELAFTTLSVEGKLQNLHLYLTGSGNDSQLRLGSHQRSFQIGVSSMNYLTEPYNNYYYRLSEKDEWIENEQKNVFVFSQLSYGRHTLYIKYKNHMMDTESPVFKLTIDITPPWYLTRLAYLCYLLLTAALVWLLLKRWKKRQLEELAIETERQNQISRDQQYEEKMQFLTNVVHELNTPLTLIYGPCERLLSHEAGNPFVKKYVGLIERNLQRLNWLIQEVIDFRRVSTGHHVIAIRRVDMTSLMNSFFEAFSEMADRTHISYQRQIAEGIVWNSDPKALARIVSNLISNAFKYTPQGGRIEVTFTKADDEVALSVYNTGSGLSEEEQKRIFDYFSVFSNTEVSLNGEQTSRNGIGMAICHNMVRLLGGTISIDSRIGEYTRFVVTLPPRELPEGTPADQAPVTSDDIPNNSYSARPASDIPAVVKANTPKQSKPMTGETGCTILAIDDNQEILDLLDDALQDYHLVTAHNGDEALERLKEEQPDLIITDLMMPGTDGLDFIQQVKQDRHTMHIPLIILSAKSSEDERIEGLESGADAYINKPFSIAYLRTVVNRLIENRKELKDYYNSGASAHSYMFGKLVSGDDQEFIDSVVQLMDSHLNDADFTAEKLSNLLGISLRNLYRKFESAQLPTPKEYIRTYRINAAARMLTTTSMTVQEIIYRTGFNTRSQFYTEFKKLFGVTPVEYRRQRQSNE